MGKKVIKITEEAYNAYVNGEDLKENKLIIDEAQHYPDFLDNVKMEVVYHVTQYVNNMIKNKQYELKDTVVNMDYYKQYFDSFTLNVRLFEDEDIDNDKNYGAKAFSDEKLEKGKLIGAKITVNASISNKWETDISRLRYVVSHEVTHLFDDWDNLSRGGEGVFNNKETTANVTFMKKMENDTNKIIKSLRWIAYLSIKTESNAFTQQLMQELERLKATRLNIKEKFRETVSYNNMKKSEIEFNNALKNTNFYELLETNNIINDYYSHSSIPKMNPNQFDAEKYLNRLKNWGERVLHKLSRRYYGVVQLYHDRLNEEYYKHNCILVHD